MTTTGKLPACHDQIQTMADRLRLNQQDLKASGNLSRAAMSNYFHGKGEPRFSTIQRWGQAYGLSMDWFFYGTGDILRAPSGTSDNLPAVRPPQLLILRGGESDKPPVEVHTTAEKLEAWIKIMERTEDTLIRHGASPERIQEAIINLTKNIF